MHLTLFFTRQVGLHTWAQNGMLGREVALYQGLLAQGVRVSFVTHGLAHDLDYRAQVPGIEILCNVKGRSPERYASWLRFLFARTLARTDVIKTNQLDGGEIALRAARFWRKPLVARCGYRWSEFLAHEQGPESAATRYAYQVEAEVFGAANQIVVTTPMMQADLIQQWPTLQTRLHVIPNFVETDHFKPLERPKEVDIIFIGRLHPQKNLASLLEALTPLAATLWVIGSGPLADSLQAQFGDLDGRVRWLGNVPHAQLPDLLNRARLFILPSHYEGHPKTLIEAMACGLPVIGADSPGIREVLQHQQTGYLCSPTPTGLAGALQYLLERPSLQAQLGQQARRFALEHYALAQVIQQELAVLKLALKRP